MISNEMYSIILPGRIIEFFPETQTATVIICAERVTHSSQETHKLTDRGVIEGVPVHTPSGGGWAITFPIKTGDTCLLLFSQVGYDHWFYEDRDTAGTLADLPSPHLYRQFEEDDGFAFVGINTLKRVIKDYHPTDSQWRGPDSALQVISLNDDKTITIKSDTKVIIEVPITEISNDCTIGGTLKVTGATTHESTVNNKGAVTNDLTVSTLGITTTGGIAVVGGAAADMGSGAITSTGSLVVNGINLETHIHGYTWTDGAGSGSTSPPT